MMEDDAAEGEKPAAKKRNAAEKWTPEECLALERGKTKLSLQNAAVMREEPELSNRSTGQINKKLRGDMKAMEKANGGDPGWVDNFKLITPSKAGMKQS
ncbi:unnamed protein product [Sympodiomycopsis kandeliae]